MAQKRNRYGSLPLVVSIPTVHLFAFQCLLRRTRLEQTWANGSFLSWMVVNGAWLSNKGSKQLQVISVLISLTSWVPIGRIRESNGIPASQNEGHCKSLLCQ